MQPCMTILTSVLNVKNIARCKMILFDLPDLISLDYPDDRDALKKALDHFKVTLDEISHGRHQSKIWIRQMVQFYLFENGYSQVEIGNIFHQDRTTVYHSIKTVRNYCELYPFRRKEVEELIGITKTDSKLANNCE